MSATYMARPGEPGTVRRINPNNQLWYEGRGFVACDEAGKPTGPAPKPATDGGKE